MYRERPARVAGAVVWPGAVVWRSAVGRSVVGRSAVPPADPAQRVLPDGCMDLLWMDGELLVAGPDTAAYVIALHPGAVYTGLRFPPGTGPAVVGMPARELRDQRVPLAELWPAADVRRLTDQVAAAADPAAALEDIAADRLRRAGPPDPVVAGIVTRLRAGRPVARIARDAGLSERQLHRRCLSAFGYGPKTLGRILRLHRALGAARAGTPFATVAATAGYADQAHLSREVKALTGVPLGTLLA